jgi:hypothetical protein
MSAIKTNDFWNASLFDSGKISCSLHAAKGEKHERNSSVKQHDTKAAKVFRAINKILRR